LTYPTLTLTLSLHDALPISQAPQSPALPSYTRHPGTFRPASRQTSKPQEFVCHLHQPEATGTRATAEALQMFQAPRKPKFSFGRSEEHTSELQSRVDLVCRL